MQKMYFVQIFNKTHTTILAVPTDFHILQQQDNISLLLNPEIFIICG